MVIIYRIRSVFVVTLKHLWAQRGLTFATLLGLTIAVALIMVVPLYADAVSFRVLETNLQRDEENGRPPFAYMFNYIGAWRGAIQWEDVAEADEYMMGSASRLLRLNRELAVHHFETDIYQVFAQDAESYENDENALRTLSFGTTSDLAEKIALVEGQFPNVVTDPNAPIEVLITRALADRVGWQVGELYTAYNGRVNSKQETFPIRIAGIWEPTNRNDPYWFYDTRIFDDVLSVPEETFRDRIAPAIDDEINLATWYWIMDGSRVGTQQVNTLIGATSLIERRLQNLLPDASTFVSPSEALLAYRRDVDQLSQILFAFNVPTIGLILAFVGLVGSLAANQRRNEFAVLRSRGGTAIQIVAVALLEFLILGVIAYILGALLGLAFTQSMGRARSFMDFSADAPLRVAMNEEALRAGLVAIILAIIALLIPVISTSRHTIISYKLTQARAMRPPWWQRAWLDVILLAITIYGVYTLNEQGGLIASVSSGNAFQNPLLFWLPAVTIFAISLLFLRLLPLLMRAISWLLVQTNNVTLLQAARYLARTPQHYNTPLLLLILTVSFSIFTASIAKTLDFYLYDEAFYQAGANVNLATSTNNVGSFGGLGGEEEVQQESSFVFLPISEYESIEGVNSAARVGSYKTTARVGTDVISGTYMGIDPYDFSQTAYWRWDFSPARIGTLMNALSGTPEGVLVPRSFLSRYGVRGGDVIGLKVLLEGSEVELQSQIVGVFDYFPTWYPIKDPILIVGNLDTLFEQAGSEFPYRVWLDTQGEVDKAFLSRSLMDRQLFGATFREPYSSISSSLLQPERQGLFGLLSVGFVAAAILTVLGLLLYAVFSYRRRMVELGVLRAVGLSAKKMTQLVGWELVLLILSGLVLGTTLGVAVSNLFIPFLQVGETTRVLVPPFMVVIAWDAVSQVYFLFAILFCIALASLVMLAMRMKIFMAIKLGETV